MTNDLLIRFNDQHHRVMKQACFLNPSCYEGFRRPSYIHFVCRHTCLEFSLPLSSDSCRPSKFHIPPNSHFPFPFQATRCQATDRLLREPAVPPSNVALVAIDQFSVASNDRNQPEYFNICYCYSKESVHLIKLGALTALIALTGLTWLKRVRNLMDCVNNLQV